MEIIPAILEQTWPEVEKKIKLVDGLTDWIQIDISDGVFTPNKTWNNPDDLSGLNLKSKIEIHLMVANPLKVLGGWFINPVGCIIIHAEPLNVKHRVSNINKEIVLGFKIETPWELYQDLIKQTGRVLFLSVEPGFQGQALDEKVFDKIKTLKSALPSVKIAVDGGINLENIESIKSAGADAAIIGSGIFSTPDPRATLDKYRAIGV